MRPRIERLQSGEGERWRSIRLCALEEAPYAFGTTLAEAARWSSARWAAQVTEFSTFVAVIDGRDVGVARGAAQPRSELRELISMWVAPSARRQGIGALLIESVAAWATSAGASTLVLDVVAGNAPALAMYEHCGFARCEHGVFGEPEPGEIRLARSLAAPVA
jgi:GNAT superfamily N-acetyltransferase